NFVGTEPAEMLALSVEHFYVRAEKLVCGTGEEVAVDGGDIDGFVRAIVDGVDIAEGAGGVGKLGDGADRVNRADRVGGVSDSNQLRILVDLGSEVGQIQRAVFVINFGPTNRKPTIFRHGEPW